MIIRYLQYYLMFVFFILVISVQAQEVSESGDEVLVQEIKQKVDQYQVLFKNKTSIQSDSLSALKNNLQNIFIDVNDLDNEELKSSVLSENDVVTGNNRILQIIESIRANSQILFDSNVKLSNQLIGINDPDSLQVQSQSFINNHKDLKVGIKMINGLRLKKKEVLKLFEKPINVSDMSEFFNIESSRLQKLLGSNSNETTSERKTDVVVKGYSPFSNVYQEFAFFTDSLKNQEKQSETTKKEEKKVSEVYVDKTSDYHIGIETMDLESDSLFQIALADSLFPHELISKYDKESLKKYWAIYRNQWTEPLKLRKANIDLTTPKVASSNLSASILKSQQEDDQKIIDLIDNTTKKVTDEIGVSVIEKQIILNSDKEKGGVNYFVQIAASRTPISKRLLSVLYDGKDTVNIRHEEGWMKYQIGGTSNYSDAVAIKKGINVPGAFVVAYNKNDKQILWKTKSWQQYSNQSSGLEFVVQVSANQKQLNANQKQLLEKKYGGVIREVLEDGWYKYQLLVGKSYPEAIKQWKQIGVKVSFVVAYHNDKKIKLSEGIKIYNAYKSK